MFLVNFSMFKFYVVFSWFMFVASCNYQFVCLMLMFDFHFLFVFLDIQFLSLSLVSIFGLYSYLILEVFFMTVQLYNYTLVQLYMCRFVQFVQFLQLYKCIRPYIRTYNNPFFQTWHNILLS